MSALNDNAAFDVGGTGYPRTARTSALSARAPATSHRESDDTYPVVAQISDRVRVINCRDDIQWIVQKRVNKSTHSWRGKSFCRTRAALIRDTRRWHDAELPADALAVLQALPERHA